MNRDEVCYQTSTIYRPLFATGNYSTGKPALLRHFLRKSQPEEDTPMADRNAILIVGYEPLCQKVTVKANTARYQLLKHECFLIKVW